MTNNQLAENSVNQLLNSVRLARDNAERADNRVDHSFYYALTIALEELQERRKTGSEPYGFTDGDRRGMIYKPEYADRLNEPLPVYRHAQPAPVVPDAYVRDEHGRMMLNGVCEPKIGFGTGWNACRAAMLAAAPQEVKGE
ncbi:Eaa1 [Klebsiella pneumoniae]|nr:Eaa1 [Klebsiella pneumoniae]